MRDVAVNAPYGSTPIPLFLSSITGMRYRSINCVECGAEFIERNNDTMYRLNDPDLPNEVSITSASTKAKCGKCSQWYSIQISIDVTYDRDSIPLYLQPESMYITVAADKKLRYLHCMECGKPFHSISDRVSQIIDNRVPFEYLQPNKIGPLEALCHYNNCGQTWALMVC